MNIIEHRYKHYLFINKVETKCINQCIPFDSLHKLLQLKKMA
jgi:hypothetical protein